MDWYSYIFIGAFLLLPFSKIAYQNRMGRYRQKIKELYGSQFDDYDEGFLTTFKWRNAAFIRLEKGKYAIVDLGSMFKRHENTADFKPPQEIDANQIANVQVKSGFSNATLVIQLHSDDHFNIPFADFLHADKTGSVYDIAASGRNYKKLNAYRQKTNHYMLQVANLIKSDCGLSVDAEEDFKLSQKQIADRNTKYVYIFVALLVLAAMAMTFFD